jgi:ATP-binding cassette, subfamily B, multidrug efflux pump
LLGGQQRAAVAEAPPARRVVRGEPIHYRSRTLARLRRSPYRRLWAYFGKYRAPLIVGCSFLLVGRLLLTWAPDALRNGVNVLSRGGAGAVDEGMRQAYVFLGITIAGCVCVWAMRRLLIGASRQVERDLKRDLFDALQRAPIAWFDRMRTGDLMSRLTSDVEAVRFSLGPGLMYVLGTFVTFPAALVLMARVSVPLMLATLVPLLAVLAFVKVLSPAIFRRTRAVQDRTGDLSARAQESFAGARVVRAYATEDVEVAAFLRANTALVTETVGLARLRAWMTAGLYLLGGLAELVVLVLGGQEVAAGRLGAGDLTAFLAWVAMLIWPMISVGWVVSAFQRSGAAAQRIDEVLSTPPEEQTLGTPAELPERFAGRLSVRGLTFTYPAAAEPALRDVSVELPAGGTLAVVGPVGAGKSTLLRLLGRLYEPPPGTVFVDGIDVTRIPLPRLRAAVAAVPQDAFLFSDTIAANLAYAVAEPPSRERLLAVAGTAGLAPDLEAFPKHLDTVLGERGVTLSGGQKQRAALARALLTDAPVLLLDDALSAVDTHTEETILAGLAEDRGRRTTVITAHRLSTVRHATHILVLDRGRVVEQGPHDALLKAQGWYARTHAAQRIERALEELR